jgi:membrane fusion protein (multidrug efflux system)
MGKTYHVAIQLFLLFLLIFYDASLAPADSSPAGRALLPVVSVQPVHLQDVNPPREYVGRVETIQAVDLRARVEGFLEEVHFKEGTLVKKNELLYVIEPAPYKAKMNEIRAQVAHAEASLKKTQQYLKRLRNVRSGGVSQTDIEAAEAEEHQAAAALQEARANLEQARLDFNYTTIEAPISGHISRSTYSRGNLVGPTSEPLARIVQLDPIRAVFSVSERDYVEAKSNPDFKSEARRTYEMIPRIKLPNDKLFDHAGKLDFIEHEVDPATGTIPIRAVFDNPDYLLLPGQFVTIQISHQQPRKWPVVPQAAVQEDREGRYVFVVDHENRVHQRRIKTGAVLGTVWVVESGLSAGEMVIVQGVQKVRPGQTVTTQQEQTSKRK